VFRKETGEAGDTGYSQATDEEGDLRDTHFPAKPSHQAHILLATHSVYHAAGAKKQQCFEKSMCHHMKYGRSISTYPQCQEHKAKLANGRVGKYFLNIILPDGYRCSQYCGSKAYNSYYVQYIRT